MKSCKCRHEIVMPGSAVEYLIWDMSVERRSAIKRNIMSLLMLCVLLIMGCSTSEQAGTSDALQVKVGDTFVIELDSNRTTGYSWTLAETDPTIIEQVSNVYKPRETADRRVGSGGTEVWTFKAIAPGKITLTFQYARPWENGVPPVKDETRTIIIR